MKSGIGITGDLKKILELFGNENQGKRTISNAKSRGMRQALAFFERQIKKNIQSGGNLAGKPFKKLSEVTINIKGSDKPLMDVGDLIGNVKPKYLNENNGFVGVARGKVHKKGGEVAEIAAVHEFGTLDSSKVDIPARPFVGPVMEAFQEEAGEMFLKAMEYIYNE